MSDIDFIATANNFRFCKLLKSFRFRKEQVKSENGKKVNRLHIDPVNLHNG